MEWANLPQEEGNWAKSLWILVEKAKQGSHTFVLAPLEEINANQNPLDFDENSICGYIGSIQSQESQDKVLWKLPQYLG